MKQFFLIGPLRTGSSLLARCLDDHPAIICLCESEINRTLFCNYAYHLHFNRMIHHGLNFREIAKLLSDKRQDEISSLERWYRQVFLELRERYGKVKIQLGGDKSPDFFREPQLVNWLTSGDKKLVYTVRDPRGIYSSILNGPGEEQEVGSRWNSFKQNFLVWKRYLELDSLLVIKYEDLVRDPEGTMREVYAHLGVDQSSRFVQDFQRLFPSRFLWKSNTDWTTGGAKQFDVSKIQNWRSLLSDEERSLVEEDEIAVDFMRRFDYSL